MSRKEEPERLGDGVGFLYENLQRRGSIFTNSLQKWCGVKMWCKVNI